MTLTLAASHCLYTLSRSHTHLLGLTMDANALPYFSSPCTHISIYSKSTHQFFIEEPCILSRQTQKARGLELLDHFHLHVRVNERNEAWQWGHR